MYNMYFLARFSDTFFMVAAIPISMATLTQNLPCNLGTQPILVSGKTEPIIQT